MVCSCLREATAARCRSLFAEWAPMVEERPLQGRVHSLTRSNAALEAPLFHNRCMQSWSRFVTSVILREVGVRGANANTGEGSYAMENQQQPWWEFSAAVKTPVGVILSAFISGVLRLRKNFAARSPSCVQDDRA